MTRTEILEVMGVGVLLLTAGLTWLFGAIALVIVGGVLFLAGSFMHFPKQKG